MYALRLLTGQYLDLPPRGGIVLNFDCPVFDPQRIDRLWSFPLNLPRTPGNERALGGAGRIDAVAVGKKLPATLIIERTPFEEGIVRVTKATAKQITVVFQSRAVDLADRAEKTKLRDLSIPIEIATPFVPELYFEIPRPVGLTVAEIVVAIDGKNYFHYFHEPDIWVEKVNADYPGLITLTSTSGNLILLQFNPIEGINELEIDFNPHYDPDPVLNSRAAYLNLIDLNYAAEYERVLQAYADYDVEGEDSPFRLPTMYVPQLYDEKNEAWQGVANIYDQDRAGYRIIDEEQDTRDGWATALLPQPRVLPLLERVYAQLGMSLTGAAISDQELRELLIYNNHDITIFIQDLGPNLIGDLGGINARNLSWIGARISWNLADHVPDIDALQLLNLFTKTFAQIITVEPGRVKLTSIRDLLRTAPRDWTNRIEPTYGVDYAERKSPVLEYARQGDDNIFAGQLERVQLGTATDTEAYTVPVFSTFEQERDITGVRMRVPVIEEVGRNERFDVGNEARLRFFFHRGLQPAAAAGRVFPQAGHSVRSFSGQAAGKYSMNWNGEHGLYRQWWSELIELLTYGRTDRRRVRLGIAELLELKRWRSVRRSYVTRQGTAVGVIRSARVRVTAAGIEPATVTLQLEPS